MAKILLWILLSLSVIPPYLNAETGEPNHKVPLFLSFICPGGGQIYNVKYVKAGIYAAVEGVLIYGAIIQNERLSDSKEKLDHYRDTGDLYKIDKFEFLVDTYTNERNNFIWMSIGAVLLSAGDAYVDSKFKSFKRDMFAEGDRIGIVPGVNKLTLLYEW